jgi:LCP family protein required for cell wall assembly
MNRPDARSMDSIHRAPTQPNHPSYRTSPGPHSPPPRKKGSRVLKRVLTTIVSVIVILAVVVLARAANLSSKIFVGQTSSFFRQVAGMINPAGQNVSLVGEDTGQINVLLLGIGGEGHDGPYLTDTMILAQIRPGDKKISLVSIPRDYFVPVENIGYAKINAAFAEGYARHHDYNEAGQWAMKTVEQISGLDIPYFAVVDFSGFEKAIDLLGGVDVHVDRTFTDYAYPDEKEGYLPPQTFTAGDEHMNGARALIFARSRHAPGPEGSDFARGVRQQKIIHATKDKALQLNLITDAGKINSLLSVLGDHFHTNLALPELYHLYALTKDYSKDAVINHSLDPSTSMVCDGTSQDGAYILTNCTGVSKTAIENFFKDSFTAPVIAAGQTGIVWLADTNKNPAIYKAAEQKLTKAGFTVYSFVLGGPTLNQTLVYPLNSLPDAVNFIKQQLNATEVSTPPPGVTLNKARLDILVMLGKDAESLLTAK